jgi:hypothetical protein
MTTWGVLRLPDGSVSGGLATGDGAVAAAVAAHLDGAVALGHDVPLAVALTSLPEGVDLIVELDAEDAATGHPGELIARLVAQLDADHAAVVAARPVADALKEVEGDVVQGGPQRDGLYAPCLPHVYRREALAGVLVDVGAEAPDVLRMLIDAGHAVRVVPVDGSPITSLRPHRA